MSSCYPTDRPASCRIIRAEVPGDLGRNLLCCATIYCFSLRICRAKSDFRFEQQYNDGN